jgi:methylated-DNA-[protein]-cysteine S-methyltransferase
MTKGFASVFKQPKNFRERVFAVVADISKGKVMTYGEVALYAGSPGASRAVGTILKSNFNPKIPCHRVIRSDGKLGEYNRGTELKRKRLQKEGVNLKAYVKGESNRKN